MPPMSRGYEKSPVKFNQSKGIDRFHPTCIFLAIVVFRVVNSLNVRTFFQPDEYYQSLEPAWELAFGPNSGAYITWEWQHQLRSSLHPLLFALVYQLTAFTSSFFSLSFVTSSRFLLLAPKIFQGILAALGDYFTWTLARNIFGQESHAAWNTVALSLCSPWQFFVSVRTFSNSLETTLTAGALCLWPWIWTKQSQPSLWPSLLLAATAVIVRPTNLLIWIPLGAFLIWRGPTACRIRMVTHAILSGLILLFLSALADCWFYGKWTFPAIQFLNFNIKQGIAVYYGRNRLDYYFTEGLGLLLMVTLPITLLGIFRQIRIGTFKMSQSVPRQALAPCLLSWTILFVMLTLSVVSHKEVRFIYPLLPALHVITGQRASSLIRRVRGWGRAVVLMGLLCNILIAYYISQVHQRGVIDVMDYLREQHEEKILNLGRNVSSSVGVLMPCHSIPWRSHLVYSDIDIWALTCEPPVGIAMEDRADYLDENDDFYANPKLWITQNMEPVSNESQGGKRRWPEKLVFFEQLEPMMHEVLGQSSYKECFRTFNSHWHDDWRRRGDIVVYCK